MINDHHSFLCIGTYRNTRSYIFKYNVLPTQFDLTNIKINILNKLVLNHNMKNIKI